MEITNTVSKSIDTNLYTTILKNENFYKYVIISCLLIILLILIVFIDINTYIGYLIHNRIISPYLVNLFNHPLKEAYKYSKDLEKNHKINKNIDMGGFNRITPLIKRLDKIYDVSPLLEEIKSIQLKTNDTSKALGDPIVNAGNKYSYYIRIFNCNSKYTQYAPKCLELIDSIANELNCKAIGISIAIMEPNTWIKFHEGFVGYGEYITRGIIGIDCPDNLCALHISNGNIINMENGKMITFDDCSMHEAWNCSNTKSRTVIIFDLWTGEGFSDGEQALDDITKNLDTNHQVLKNPIRKKISLNTIKIIRDVINSGKNIN